MKKLIMIVAVLICANASFALSASEIIDKAEKLTRQEHTYSVYRQIVVTKSGKKFTYKVEAFSRNGNEKQLIRYLEPSRVRGVSTLMLNDGNDIWTYFPRTGRVRLIARHMRNQKMMGSEFTYEDMSMSSYKKKYKLRLGKDTKVLGKMCYQVIMTPLKDSSYSKIVVYINKESYVMQKVDFTRKGEKTAYKRMLQAKVKLINGVPTPMVVVMQNLVEKLAKTTMIIDTIDYKRDIPQSMFTTSAMKK